MRLRFVISCKASSQVTGLIWSNSISKTSLLLWRFNMTPCTDPQELNMTVLSP